MNIAHDIPHMRDVASPPYNMTIHSDDLTCASEFHIMRQFDFARGRNPNHPHFNERALGSPKVESARRLG